MEPKTVFQRGCFTFFLEASKTMGVACHENRNYAFIIFDKLQLALTGFYAVNVVDRGYSHCCDDTSALGVSLCGSVNFHFRIEFLVAVGVSTRGKISPTHRISPSQWIHTTLTTQEQRRAELKRLDHDSV